jgi:hypothetical protein
MNTSSVWIIVVALLPSFIVAILTLWQVYGEKDKMEKLWADHNKITGATDDERKQRQDIRQAIHTLKQTGAASGLDMIRHSVALALVGVQVGIVIWLAENSGVATPQFYVLAGFLAASLVLTGMLLTRNSHDF